MVPIATLLYARTEPTWNEIGMVVVTVWLIAGRIVAVGDPIWRKRGWLRRTKGWLEASFALGIGNIGAVELLCGAAWLLRTF